MGTIEENFYVDVHICFGYFPITLLTALFDKFQHKLGHFVVNKLVVS